MLRKCLRNALFAVGFFAATSAAFALIVPPTYGPREFATQQTHYLRFSVNFNSCVYSSLVCTVKVGAVPYNAAVLRIYWGTGTAWNAGTSSSVGLGTTSTAAINLLASTNVQSAAPMTAATVVSANLGTAATGSGIASTGADGGFDIYATVTIVGALPTAGSSQFIVEYVAANDGACAPVPLGSTAPAC